MPTHLDTDVLVYAAGQAGPERRRLFTLVDSGQAIHLSAWVWYEFRRGPRTPEQLAVARLLIEHEGIIPFSGDLAERAAEVFRSLGSPRHRAADIAIGVTAAFMRATLLSRNAQDFAGIPELDLEVVS